MRRAPLENLQCKTLSRNTPVNPHTRSRYSEDSLWNPDPPKHVAASAITRLYRTFLLPVDAENFTGPVGQVHSLPFYDSPDEIRFTRSLGKKLLILDVDNRPLGGPGGILNSTWSHIEETDFTSVGRLSHYIYGRNILSRMCAGDSTTVIDTYMCSPDPRLRLQTRASSQQPETIRHLVESPRITRSTTPLRLRRLPRRRRYVPVPAYPARVAIQLLEPHGRDPRRTSGRPSRPDQHGRSRPDATKHGLHHCAAERASIGTPRRVGFVPR